MPCAIPTLATNLNHAWKGACSLPLHADEQPSSDQRWVTTIPQHHTQLRSLCRKLCSTLLRIQHTYARLSASARTGTSHGPNHSTGTKKTRAPPPDQEGLLKPVCATRRPLLSVRVCSRTSIRPWHVVRVFSCSPRTMRSTQHPVMAFAERNARPSSPWTLLRASVRNLAHSGQKNLP